MIEVVHADVDADLRVGERDAGPRREVPRRLPELLQEVGIARRPNHDGLDGIAGPPDLDVFGGSGERGGGGGRVEWYVAFIAISCDTALEPIDRSPEVGRLLSALDDGRNDTILSPGCDRGQPWCSGMERWP